MAVMLCGGWPLFKRKDCISTTKHHSTMTEEAPTLIQGIEPYGFFDEAIENRQLTDCLVIYMVIYAFNLASDELDIFWTSAEFQEDEMEILFLIQPPFEFRGISDTYDPWLVRSCKPYSNDCLSNSNWCPVTRILRGLHHVVQKCDLSSF